MVLRIPEDGEEAQSGSSHDAVYVQEAAAHRNITADIIDQAVEDTFREAGVPEETQSIMREMLARDSSSAVAQAYYSGLAAGGSAPVRPISERPRLNIPYVLTESEVALLVDYAPDFNLRFYDGDNHDHPLAAACRLIDRRIIMDRIPAGASLSDLGGAIVPLINSGELGVRVHTCAPILDVKDPSRRTLVEMRAKMMAKDVTQSVAVRESAGRYLRREMSAICDKRAQECTYKTPCITSVHVYDIPMEDWAGIMSRKGASLAEGCILFPEGIFGKSEGVMASAGARYECNARDDTFKMGFIGSPSWWYTHSLADYLRYGVDQVLRFENKVYSYKVVERRGDTLYFRILLVANDASPQYRQYYRVPGVPMVIVDGFKLTTRTADMRSGLRARYTFPALLWADMLGCAKDMVERNTLSHERLYNYYRTVSPRQSINSVIVCGGATVDDLNQLLPLIVHVALFALMEVAKSKVETTAITASIMRERAIAEESTWYKLGAAFGNSMLAALKVSFYPFLLMADAVDNLVTNRLLRDNYEWHFQPEYVQVSAKLLLHPSFSERTEFTANDDLIEYVAENAADDFLIATLGDPATAELTLEMMGGYLDSELERKLRDVVEESKEEQDAVPELVSPATDSTPKAYGSQQAVSGAASVDTQALAPMDEVNRRYDSIREAIVECESESAKCEAACADQYMQIMTSGVPNVRVMSDRREMFGNPDFWFVEDGLLIKSILGMAPSSFEHAAVYAPVVSGGTRLYRVFEEEFNGMSGGVYVSRVHYKVDVDFTGWVYVNDSLAIYNGPAIVDTMKLAMQKPMDFSVELIQGPPGCGKTTQIIERTEIDDVVLVPVRKAARETADRLVKAKGKSFSSMAKMRVRTLDSYLVNYLTNDKIAALHSYRLLADEAFMAREGRWLAAAALLGVRRVTAFGDREQIPHVPRAECPKSYVTLQYQDMTSTFVSYRCPPELVACWSHVYEHRVRSASKEVGDVRQVSDSGKLCIPKGCVMMGMYQADKKLLAEKYANCGVPIKIMTVHESQGNTYEHVWLHRFDLRKRDDKFSLYDRPPYALVAMSRSTKSFIYIAPKTIGDCVTKWLALGEDPRRRNAVADVESAGKSIEFA